MLRFAIAALLLFATPSAAQVAGTLGPNPVLKREAAVASDLVRIGDLVENAGDKARVPIFRSPDLGHTGTVQATRITDALRTHGILVIDTRDIVEVVVTRASRPVTLKEIETEIARALGGQHGLSEAASLTIMLDRDARPVQLEASATGALRIERLFHDPRSGRFDVTFDLPGSAIAHRVALRYTGTVIDTVQVAVLNRPIARGEMVRATDIAIERRPKAEMGQDIANLATDVVGLAARRALRPGSPLRLADVMKPELVQRNEPVTLVYESPGIMLTVRGKAIETGAEGDVIRVLNEQSKRTVTGTVTGNGRVVVTGMAPRLAASVEAPAPPLQPRSE
jgi:flagella basal body P-ring formation protein FlgA